MTSLTEAQQLVLDFVLSRWESGEALPSSREIMSQFGWASPKASTDVLEVLKRKGLLAADAESSRKYRLTEAAMGIPVLGEIAAGIPTDQSEFSGEHFMLNPSSLGVRNRSSAFFLQVTGDSMVGRNIFDGDLVLIEKVGTPGNRAIVAALIDGQSTLKTLIREKRKTWLQSENPDYQDLIPVEELQIQGVARGVIRPLKS